MKKEVPQDIKVEVIRKIVRPTLLYGHYTQVSFNRLKSKLNAMEIRFLRRIEGKH